MVAVPAQDAVAAALGDAGLPRPVVQRLQPVARMIAFVGDQLGRRFRRRRRVDGGQVFGRGRERARQGRGVALVGGVHLGRDHRAGVEVQSVLGLVGEMRPAILQLGDLRVRVGRAFPVGVGQLLVLAGAVQPDQVISPLGGTIINTPNLL
jgi:hypothetical protein